MTEDEATTVAKLAARCVWGGRRYLGLIMRYGRLFRPGTETGGGAYPMMPAMAGPNAYRRAMDSGLLYAEGYARHRGIATHSAWCLDGETVVDPGFSQPGTAYFGVALRPGYMRVPEPPVLVTRNGVSYEMALMAIFRAMGDEIPENFAVCYQR